MSEGTAQSSKRKPWLTIGPPGSSSDPDSKPASTSDPDLKSDSTSGPRRKRDSDESIGSLESRPQPDGARCPRATSNATPAHKKPLVGWPPVPPGMGRSRRAKFVKVAVAGAPYQRKVDLEAYAGYKQLLAALQGMFASHFSVRKAGNEEMKLVDVVSGTEYVPTYEDKEGDLMLVGDVPWRMFVDTCQRLRLMKSSEAVNLSPRASQ